MQKNKKRKFMPATINELEKIRDILYGEQMREVNEHIAALEANLQTLSKQINGQISALDQESRQKLAQQSEEMNRLSSEQGQKLKEESQGLVGQIEAIRKQIENEAKLSQKRDEALKKEVLDLLAKLESGKVARAELGQALIELGQSVQHAK
jgi:predicted metallo-beta-lactamase superfamily hydrolase